MENHFGRYPLVQTVVTDPEKLPGHLLADEKITWLNGEEVVVATTVGDDCVLGVSVALGAATESLTEAYQHFKDEAQALKAEYAPETVNTDGWSATQRAWLNLFPLVILIECFLHAFIKIRERGKHLTEIFTQLSQPVWDVYRATDAASFRYESRRTPSLGRKEYDGLCSGGRPKVMRQNGTLCFGLRVSTGPSYQ